MSENLTYSMDGYRLIAADAAARLSLLICNTGLDTASSRHSALYTANTTNDTRLVGEPHLPSDQRHTQLDNMKKAAAMHQMTPSLLPNDQTNVDVT